MGDGALGGHAHAVFHGGVGQGLIPNEAAAAFLLACLVGEGEQLLGLGGLRDSVALLREEGRRVLEGSVVVPQRTELELEEILVASSFCPTGGLMVAWRLSRSFAAMGAMPSRPC